MRHAAALTIATLLAAASAAYGQITTPAVLVASDATNNEPIQVYDVTSGTFSTLPNGVARMTGMTYNQMTQTAYVAMRTGTGSPSRLFSLPLNPPGTLTLVNNYTGSLINGTTGGLAWDPVSNRMFASMFGTIYLVDPATAANSTFRVVQSSSGSIKGMDVDPVTGDLYFIHTGSSTTPPLASTGVYRISPPLDTGPIVKIAPLPLSGGNPDTNVEGVAVGGGYVWISARTGNSLYRLRISDGVYETPIAVPFSGPSPTSGGTAFVGAAVAGADLGVAIRNGAETAVPAPGETTFNVTLRNVGTADATVCNAEIVLPGGVSFVSATNGAIFSAGVVTFSAGTLASNAAATFSVTLASASPFTATVVTTTTAGDVYIGNNTASSLSTASAPDVGVVVSAAPANCTITSPGLNAQFDFSVINVGGSAANTTLTVPIPAGASFVSSTPTGVLASGVLTIDLGAVAAGGSTPVSVTVTPGDGLYLRLTATASAAGDTNAANNSATGQTVTGIFSSAPIRALLSTAANNSIPGMSGAFSSQGTLDSIRSSDGQWIATHWKTPSSTELDLLVRTNTTTGVSSLIAQQGVTLVPPENWPIIFATFGTPGVNTAGDFSFTARYGTQQVPAPSTTEVFAAKSIGGVLSNVARTGNAVPAIPGALYGTSFSGAGITNSGQAAFIASSLTGTGIVTANNQAFLCNDGTTLICQKGVTQPAGAAGPITSLNGTGCFISGDGTRYIYSGSTTVGGSKSVVVVGTVGGSDATVLLQTGDILPGFTSPISNFQTQLAFKVAEGRWFARGSNADGEDWVLSGTGNSVSASNVVLRTGTVAAPLPITPGNTEVWDAGLSTVNNITGFTTNPRGDTLAYGKTLGDTRSDLVFVFNGTTVIAREGDPVDLDNNGVFDDDSYIRQLNFDDQLSMTNEAVYALVTLRNRQGVCDNGSTTVNSALVRIPIPQPPANDFCCRGTTCNPVTAGTCTGTIAGSMSIVRASCGAGTSFASCCYADFNHDGLQSIDDLFLYFNAYFTSHPLADFGGTGTSQPTIDDLFLYINAYFGTCS